MRCLLGLPGLSSKRSKVENKPQTTLYRPGTRNVVLWSVYEHVCIAVWVRNGRIPVLWVLTVLLQNAQKLNINLETSPMDLKLGQGSSGV